MKEKRTSRTLALVGLVASVMFGVLVAAEPQHEDAPIRIPEQIMTYPYAAHSSPAIYFPTEARLCNYLGVEYIPTSALKLEYICPFCGQDFATEGQMLNHVTLNHV